MFENSNIQTYRFDDIPPGMDLSLMDVKWMEGYMAALVASIHETEDSSSTIGYHAYAAVRAIDDDFIELSWYPNIFDRFHEVRITLPRAAFVSCIASWQYDYKPVIFVYGNWLTQIFLRKYTVFALVDAINVKRTLSSGELNRQKLVGLRNRIDSIARENPSVAFISFADSLLLKSHYTVGQHDGDIIYTYQPEKILRLLSDIQNVYHEVLGLNIYAVLTQGSNEYYDDELMHTSVSGNHISLNSLGLPFAQLQKIEYAAREAIKAKRHEPVDTYLDETFYHSLRFRFGFDKGALPKFCYDAPMTKEPCSYFPVNLRLLIDNLELPG